MPPKKETTKKQERKDLVDFITDGSQNTVLYQSFIDTLEKQGASAEDLFEFFKKEGYNGVSPADCDKFLSHLRGVGSNTIVVPKY